MKRFFVHVVLVTVLIALVLPSCADGPLVSPSDKLFGAVLPEGLAGKFMLPTYEKSAASVAIVRAHWGKIEPKDPGAGQSTYDFTSFDTQPMMDGKRTIICIVDLTNPWPVDEKNPARLRELTGRFLTALTKHAYSKGIKYFWLPADSYTVPEERPADYLADLKALSVAAKAAGKDALVIASPSAATPPAVQQLYGAGAGLSFDILAVDITSDDAKFGIDITKLLKIREIMAANGDDAKQVLVVGQLGNEAGKQLDNVYRFILTKRDMLDPNWILGAVATGKLPTSIARKFPPEIPANTFECSIEAEGPVLNYVVGKPYKLVLKFTNLSDKQIRLDKFSVDFPEYKDLAVDLKPGEMPKTAEPRAAATATYTITFPKEATGKTVILRGALDYSIDGTNQFADCYFPAMVTSELELTLLPQRLIIGNDKPQQIGMSVINHTDKLYSGDVTLKPYAGIKTSLTTRKIVVDPFGLDAFVFKVEKDAKTAPGHYAISVDVGGKLTDWIAVDVALPVKNITGSCINPDSKGLSQRKDLEPVRIVARSADGKTQDVGRGWFAYDGGLFYAEFEIDDAKHIQSGDPVKITQEDSIQIAFDPLMNGPNSSEGGYRSDDYEYALAGASANPIVMRAGKPTGVLFTFKNEGGKSYYRVAIPWSEIAPLNPNSKGYFGLSVLVNMTDGGPVQHAEWGGGLMPKVDPRAFMPAVLVQ